MEKGHIVVCIDDSIKDSSHYFNATLGNRYILKSVNKIYASDDMDRFSIVNICFVDDTGDNNYYNPKRFIELSLYRVNVIEDILS